MIHQRHADQGKFLFEYRSYLPIAFIPLLATYLLLNTTYVLGSHNVQHAWEAVCCGISLLGMIVRVSTIGFVPEGTSGRNTKHQLATMLNTTGMYSMCRNPLYLGNYLIWLGVIAFPMNFTLVLLFTAAFWLYYERIIAAEESFLVNKFGDAYRDWCAVTPVFIPNPFLWRAPALQFCPRMVLRREYTTLFAIGLAFFTFDVVSHLVVEQRFYIEFSWTALAAFSTIQYIVLRTLKRKTTLLTPRNQPDRLQVEEVAAAPQEAAA